MNEWRIRLRSWWRRHWWPARIRQLDRERADWKRWFHDCEDELTKKEKES